jgi:hypothetical protein
MQGSYNNNGLPRPYYMKPTKKRLPYTNLKEPIVFFNNPKRKLMGYLVMFMLIGTLMWWVSQDIKIRPDPEYELATHGSDSSSSSSSSNNNNINNNKNGAGNKINIDTSNHANIDNIVNAVGSKADKESENIDLAGNLAEGSKGEKGIGVAEAPKGGIANEAPVVGTDEDKLVGTGGNKAKNAGKKGYKASIGNVEDSVVAAKQGAKHGVGEPDAEDVALANKIANEDKIQQIMDEA